jgi:hypothetical protein
VPAPSAAPPRDRVAAPVDARVLAPRDRTPAPRRRRPGRWHAFRSHARWALRLLLPVCLIVAGTVAAAGLWRVLGRTTAETSSAPSVSLALGPGSAPAPAAVGPETAAPGVRQVTRPAGAGTVSASPVPVRVTAAVDVVNASSVAGLARRTATELQAKGVAIGTVGNLTAAARPTARTVYFAPGAQPQARALARLAGASAVLPAPAWLRTNGRLVLVVTRTGAS